MSFVAATTVPNRDTAGVIPSIDRGLVLGQRRNRTTFMEAGRYHPYHPATTGRGRFLFDDWHA
jgi:hypothetical protein